MAFLSVSKWIFNLKTGLRAAGDEGDKINYELRMTNYLGNWNANVFMLILNSDMGTDRGTDNAASENII